MQLQSSHTGKIYIEAMFLMLTSSIVEMIKSCRSKYFDADSCVSSTNMIILSRNPMTLIAFHARWFDVSIQRKHQHHSNHHASTQFLPAAIIVFKLKHQSVLLPSRY